MRGYSVGTGFQGKPVAGDKGHKNMLGPCALLFGNGLRGVCI